MYQIEYTKLGRQNAIKNSRPDTFDATIYETYDEAQAAFTRYLSVSNPLETGVRVRVDLNAKLYTDAAGSGIVNQNEKMHSVNAIAVRRLG